MSQCAKRISVALVAQLILFCVLPAANAFPQQLRPANSTNRNSPESPDDFVIKDPNPVSVSAVGVSSVSQIQSPKSPLVPISPLGVQSSAKIETPQSIGQPWIHADPNWEMPSLEELETNPEKGSFVQAVFSLPGPNRNPDTGLKPNATGIGQEIGTDRAPVATTGGERKLEPGSEPGFLDSLKVEDFYQVATAPFRHYRSSESSFTHLAASAGSFGWTSMEWEPYLKREQANGLTGCIQNHFLSGPRSVDLPPRLHDFILGYQHRARIGERFSFDCAASVGIFSDFRGSVREGIRFPAHAVGFIHASHRADFVFGVDYLNRKDYQILPVFGISWHDLNFTSLRYDLVFPRPRIDFTIDDGTRLYLAGRLGGGTWDFEFPNGSGSVMNYRDFRILLGREKRYLDGSRQSFEVGYVFGRQLTLQDVPTEVDFRNAVMIRLVSRY